MGKQALPSFPEGLFRISPFREVGINRAIPFVEESKGTTLSESLPDACSAWISKIWPNSLLAAVHSVVVGSNDEVQSGFLPESGLV